MKPIDIFSTRNMNLKDLKTFTGNIYVKENLDLVDTSTPLEDFIGTDTVIEIFGDVFVDGYLSGSEIIIHGNLECTELYCNSITVDGDIYVANHATVIDSMSSNNGNIHLGAIDTGNLIAYEGSVLVEKDLEAPCVKAFDSIYVGGNFTEVKKIIAGSTVTINGYVVTVGGIFIDIQVLSGGFKKDCN